MSERDVRVIAVDLGASSGRVYAADIGPTTLALTETARFANGGIRLGDRLHWDILALYRGVLDGIAAASRSAAPASVGIDSWAVDYGLLRADGTLLDNPLHHRDQRTAVAVATVTAQIDAGELYRRCGVALHPFNTLFQLVADRLAGRLEGARTALLVPDLLSYFLTGDIGAEVTNASTTGVLSLDCRWDERLLGLVGLEPSLLAPLRSPGEPAGALRPAVQVELGIDRPLAVTAVASHDTASAVVAVPAVGPEFAYISCGTWSLVGLELEAPVVTDEARLAGFTNERGIDGTFRFLRNVMGLWLLQEAIRTWERQGAVVNVADLTAAAAAVEPLRSVVDPDDPSFLPPGDMPSRLAKACAERDQVIPSTKAEVTRCILDSLALAYRRAVEASQSLTGTNVEVVHLVGGGVHNRLLCQMTADACGVPVVAGPVEAAAIGNALVQARALGAVPGDRWAMRRVVTGHAGTIRYEPDPAATHRYAKAAIGL